MLRRLLAALLPKPRPCANCGLPFWSPSTDTMCAQCQDDLAPDSDDDPVRDLLLLHD